MRGEWARGATILLLWLFFAQMATGAPRLSLTADEPAHLTHGYLWLTTGETWAVPLHGHPPLGNAWGAWPLLLQAKRPDLHSLPGWGENFAALVRATWPLLGPVSRVAFVTRYPNMLLGLVLAALLHRWARERFGAWGGVLAVGAMAFDPTMVAHAQLNTTDLPMTAAIFACLYETAQLQRSFNVKRVMGIGALFGLAMAVKGSGVLLAPVVLTLTAWKGWQHRKARGMIWSLSLTAGTALLVLWASYGFRMETAGGWELPLVAHVRMLHKIATEQARTAFFLGKVRQGGWLGYFPFAFVVKTPIPLLVALGLATADRIIAIWPNNQERDNSLHPAEGGLVLWGFPSLYVALALRSQINIGYRHMLPVLPFLHLSVGRLAVRFAPPRRIWLRFAAAGMAFWLVVGTLRVYPFALAYFNEVIGGPRNGYRYLVDSNVDWGQSFLALRDYLSETGAAWVWLSYYTWVDPAAYGIAYRPLPPAPNAPPLFAPRYDPPPGLYAISATPLQGVMVADPDLYAWFRLRDPEAQPGYGLLIYHVEPHATPPRWVAQCSVPVAPLTDQAITTGFGKRSLRVVTFDCTQSWLYPGSGWGWYALHSVVKMDRFLQRHLDGTRLSYEQRKPGELPPFRLYETEASTPHVPSRPATPPVDIGPLRFLGATLPTLPVRAGECTEVETWWRVTAVPTTPVSLMLHAVPPDGSTALVGDGLGIPQAAWQPGDVLVQRHRLTVPSDAPAGTYQLVTGVYRLDTLELIGEEHQYLIAGGIEVR